MKLIEILTKYIEILTAVLEKKQYELGLEQYYCEVGKEWEHGKIGKLINKNPISVGQLEVFCEEFAPLIFEIRLEPEKLREYAEYCADEITLRAWQMSVPQSD